MNTATIKSVMAPESGAPAAAQSAGTLPASAPQSGIAIAGTHGKTTTTSLA